MYKINGFLLSMSLLIFGSTIALFLSDSISEILTIKLLFGSIGAVAILLANYLIIKSKNNPLKLIYIFSYSLLILMIVSIVHSILILYTWNYLFAGILFLLLYALDLKLALTMLYNYSVFKLIFKIGSFILIFCTLIKIESSLILSFGVFILILLTLIALIALIIPKKESEN